MERLLLRFKFNWQFVALIATSNMRENARGMGQQAPSGFNNTKHNCNGSRPLRKGCGARTFITARNGKYSLFRFRCKSYNCGRCGALKVRHVRKRIVQLSVEHKLQRFVTLTLDPSKMPRGLDRAKKLAYLQETWRKMRESLRRKLGKSLAFISVVELQGNGNPHLHLLVGSYLDKSWLSAAWQAVGGGWATRIEYADVHRVAAYLAKYFTEDSVRDLPPGTRRFSASRGLRIFERSSQVDAWLLTKTTIEYLHEAAVGTNGERFETDQNGARMLASFVADRLDVLDTNAFPKQSGQE